MNIGVDLRALQTGHKYRGIGEVAKQVTNRLIQLALKSNPQTSFTFFEYEDDDPKLLLDLPDGLDYSVVKQGLMKENNPYRTKKDKLSDAIKDLRANQVKGSSSVDVFLQFDYAFGVPTNTKTFLVKHDLIPKIFWSQYFESAWVPFKNYAARTTLRTLFNNYKYEHVLRQSLNHAYKIIAVSQSTKNDIERLFHVSSKKISVAHLGVDTQQSKTQETSHPDSIIRPSKPYLLFVGAGDARRKVDDLVAAYNNLKAAGNDIQLVLVGENFSSPDKIPNKVTRYAVMNSSYPEDIITMGYVDDNLKQEVYRNAVAFVYPTLYEGFGIPVLESMLFSCPVITYKNSSIPEVAGKYALYAKDWSDIVTQTTTLLSMTSTEKKTFTATAKIHAQKYTWDKTAQLIYDELVG